MPQMQCLSRLLDHFTSSEWNKAKKETTKDKDEIPDQARNDRIKDFLFCHCEQLQGAWQSHGNIFFIVFIK